MLVLLQLEEEEGEGSSGDHNEGHQDRHVASVRDATFVPEGRSREPIFFVDVVSSGVNGAIFGQDFIFSDRVDGAILEDFESVIVFNSV